MARAHAVAAIIEEAADQQALGFGPFSIMVVDLFIQLSLDGFKQVIIKNRRLLPFEDFAFERDFANIEAVSNKMRERPSRERNTADGLACLECADLGDNAPPAQVGHQQVETDADGKIRVTSLLWAEPKVILKGEVLELRNADGSLHIARKVAKPDDWHPPVEPSDPYGPRQPVVDDDTVAAQP